MKDLLLVATALFGVTQVNAQEFSLDSVLDYDVALHEIRYGTLKLAIGSIFEGGYEYVFEPKHGLGVNVLINMEPKGRGEDYYEDFALNPYYRFYISKSKTYWGKGLFVEGFVNAYTGRETTGDVERYENVLVITNTERRYFETALGLAIGQKWVYKSGFVLELKAGVGNNLLGNSEVTANFKGDLSMGYRF